MAGINIDLNKLKNIKLTKEQQQYVALGVISVVAAVYGYWNYLLKPLGVQQEFWRKSVQSSTENLKKAREFKKNWGEFETRLARVQAGEQFIARRILPAAGADQIMLQVSKLALESGVGLTSFTPEDTTKAQLVEEGIYKNPGTLLISCTYHQLGAFFSKLSGENVIYNVEELELTPGKLTPQGSEMVCNSTLKFVTYSTPAGGGGKNK